MNDLRRIALATGVTLNVALAGNASAPAVILLHGFPESHRTWREVASHLEHDYFLIMPDLRGFGGSDLPQDLNAYLADSLIDDIFALAEALTIDRFILVGHDWGGAIAWAAALRKDRRLARLAIVNAPHPFIFQKSLIESEEQRSASQYINAFRAPGFETMVETKGADWFFNSSFARHVDISGISPNERQRYLADWSKPGAFKAMLNWYRASKLIVPLAGVDHSLPDWLQRKFPRISVPTLVIWGMNDQALLPLQLDGLDDLVADLTIVRLPGVGHFAPWEAGQDVASALRPFLAGNAAATAPKR